MKVSCIMGRRSALALGFFFLTNFGVAQGLVTLNTDSVQPLISQMLSLDTTVPGGQAQLDFDFGFATAESPVAGSFLDAFTVTLQNSGQTATAILFTADPTGLFLAPATPGTIIVNPASMSLNPIAYPSQQPIVPNQTAYHLSMAVPQEFASQPMNVYFDLFNNLDAFGSQAWFNNVRIAAVPEPQLCALCVLSGAILWAYRRKTRS
jgi:hypothetical protein